eukprot:jgi/Picsp_1/4940/NSC_02304-R1_---NA---
MTLQIRPKTRAPCCGGIILLLMLLHSSIVGVNGRNMLEDAAPLSEDGESKLFLGLLGSNGNNITCFSKLKCPDELPRCKKPQSLKLGYCVQCLENEDCEAGSVCDTDTNTCGSTLSSGTIWSLRYGDFTLQTFTLKDRKQVCSNILSLIPSAVSPICEVLSVLPGSVVVTGSAQFRDEASGAKLAEILTAQSNATLAALINNLNTSSVVVEAASSEDPKTSRGKPLPPTNVIGSPFCKIPAKQQFVTMTWTPTTGGSTVGYTATCVSANGINATSVVVGRSTSGTVLGPLSSSKSYLCGVESYSLTAGSGLTGVQTITTGICSKPGVPANVLATGNEDNVTVTWEDGFLGNPSDDTTFEVKCVQSYVTRAVGPSCTDQAEGVSDTGIPPGTEMGTVTQLDNSTTYECYAIATNAIGTTCSSGVSVATWGPPGTAVITGTNSPSPFTMDVDFDLSSPTGAPEEFNVIAVQIGGSCSDTPISAVMGLPEGTTSATIDGLELSTNYTFYVQAYNEYGNSCSQPFDSRTKAFSFAVGVATSSNFTLLATNLDLPFFTQCQVNGTTLSDCEQGPAIGPSTAIGIQDDIVYFTSDSMSFGAEGYNLTACDLTSPGTCNSTEVKGPYQPIDLAIANNSVYITTITDNITVCDVDGLRLGPCRSETVAGFPDIGTIGIASNETSGILYITDISQQGQLLACNTLSDCTELADIAPLPLGVGAGDGKLFVASLIGFVVICDQQGQGVDADTCETNGDSSSPILPFTTGVTYDSGVLYLASPFASAVAACNVNLTTNLLEDCEYYF